MRKIYLGVSLGFLFSWSLPVLAQPVGHKEYNIRQATSENAQLHTIAFNGLAFLTGNYGENTFFPPGKVADLFGFQYMRDNDSNQLGHNTDFLTRIALNVLRILNDGQKQKLRELALEQAALYDSFARERMVLVYVLYQTKDARFPVPEKSAVSRFCASLYAIDGELCYRRAEVMAELIRSFTPDQLSAFGNLRFGNSDSWPLLEEEKKQGNRLPHRAQVGLMTYASELFSWYKGSLDADVYFCPERHGTYFGGFYLKDQPAMHNKGYFIPTSLTGESGRKFLETLDPSQRKQIEALPELQEASLAEIVRIRTNTATALRQFLKGERPDKRIFMEQMKRYGELDGTLSWYYTLAFREVNKTLTAEQRKKLAAIRNLDVVPAGAFLYSDPVDLTGKPDLSTFYRF